MPWAEAAEVAQRLAHTVFGVRHVRFMLGKAAPGSRSTTARGGKRVLVLSAPPPERNERSGQLAIAPWPAGHAPRLGSSAPHRLCAFRPVARPIGVWSLSARPHRTARRDIRRRFEPITPARRADTAPKASEPRASAAPSIWCGDSRIRASNCLQSRASPTGALVALSRFQASHCRLRGPTGVAGADRTGVIGSWNWREGPGPRPNGTHDWSVRMCDQMQSFNERGAP